MLPLFVLFLLASSVMAPVTFAMDQTSAEPNFKGRTITMILGIAPAGRRDRIGRTIAKFLGKHLPGQPNVVVQNVPGGKGVPGMMKFSKSAADGSVIGLVVSSDMEAPYFGAPGANYDPRTFVWIGSVQVGKQRNVLFFDKRTGIKSLEDLKDKEVVMGAQGVGHRSYLYGRLIGEILGLKIRWVIGYSTPELYLAMERREIDGRVNDAATVQGTRPDWIEKKQIVPLVAMALPEYLPPLDDPLFASVPSVMQFAKKDTHLDMIRKMNTTGLLGSGIALPPGTPENIRSAFEKALLKSDQDPAFRKAWEKAIGRPYEGVVLHTDLVKGVELYTDWSPEVLETWRRLGHKPPE
jgi:tripartite-type tricarboxylate transporter receptor subunit TctC